MKTRGSEEKRESERQCRNTDDRKQGSVMYNKGETWERISKT